jgi:hypothetical protein
MRHQHHTLERLALGWGLVLLGWATALAEEPRDAAKTSTTQVDERLAFMKRSLTNYTFHPDGASSPLKELRPLAEPLLRWDNPVSNVPDGLLALWVDQHARPAAIVQVFIAAGTKDLWLHEWQSLTTEPFQVLEGRRPYWTPRRGGITWRKVAEGEAPGESNVSRLVQMKRLARRFVAEDDFEGKSRWELRLMSTPLYRYGGTPGENGVVDGALFAFAHGTDPEALVLIEAYQDATGTGWRYALAPMTGYALRMKLDTAEVWSIPWRQEPYDRREPFVCYPYSPLVP